MTKFLRTTGLGLVFLTAFIPLYVNNGLFFPFITGKAFAFRIIVEIAFAFWVLLAIRDKKYAPRFSWLTVAVTAFAIVVLIADLAGFNPLRSIWSNFERMEGWITIIHLWAFFIITTGIFGQGEEGRRNWHNFFKVSLFAAGLVGIYGFVQLFGGAEIHQGSTRIDASLGNAAYMAVYMLIHAFIAFYMALVNHGKMKKEFIWWYTALGVIFGFLVFETATRGTILGLVGGILLALGIFAVWGKGESKKARGISAGVIALIILLALALVGAKDTSFVKNSETLNRLATISWNENKSQARGYIWPVAVRGIFENPKTAIIGVGQENFNYLFNSHYNPEMWSQEQWFDRAHSVFLDWLVAGGVIGFLVYLSLFVLAIRGIWKSELTFKEKCLLTGLFVGYGIHNIFVFDNLASYMLFFTMLGFVHTLTAGKAFSWFEASDTPSENKVVIRDYIYLPAVVILLLLSLYFINVRTLQANTRLIKAMTMCGAGTPSATLYKEALDFNQYTANQEIREQLLSCAAAVIAGNNSQEATASFYNLALLETSRQSEATPNDARGYVIAGTFFNNITDWENGRKFLEKANELSPNKQSLIAELATNYINTGKTKEALVLLEKAYLSAPENENIKAVYGSVLVLAGEEAKAQELFKDTPDFWTSPRIINVYIKSKQYAKAAAIVKSLIAKDPQNMQYYGLLSSIYYQSGDIASTIATLETIKAKFPLTKDQIDATIAELRAPKK